MRTKSVYGKVLRPDALPAATYLPDDYDLPCYSVTIESAEYEYRERCYYYADILVNADLQIQKIERYKDNYMINIPVKVFPPMLEAVFEGVLEAAT